MINYIMINYMPQTPQKFVHRFKFPKSSWYGAKQYVQVLKEKKVKN